jgi:agmatine deiminase
MDDVVTYDSYYVFWCENMPGGIIVPSFGCPADVEAVRILQECFPGRKVVSVPGREILLGGGNIHCITQQAF